MPIALMPLPFKPGALDPAISARTIRKHHGAHHKAYVAKANKGAAAAGLTDLDLNALVLAAHDSGNTALFNAAAQAWNHGFYWHSLTPRKTRPDAALAEAVERDFGSLAALKKQLAERATDHFASGWVWLALAGKSLKIVETADAGTLLIGKAVPLLTIDVWEHAYYLDRQDKRAAYVKAVVKDHLDWGFASRNFASNGRWIYPG